MLQLRDSMPVTEAVNYLYNIDFAEIANMFAQVKVGDTLPAEFLPVLGGVTGDKWVADVPGPFTLLNSQIEYIGPNDPLYRSCSWFTDIVVVRLAPECQALQGALVFHLHRCS